jgi:hypothetical protein
MPVAIGVLLDNPAETSWEVAVHAQNAEARERVRTTELAALLRQGATWEMRG